MQHHVYSASDHYPVAILVKASAFNRQEIEATYVAKLEAAGISRDDLILVALPYNDKGKAPQKFIKEQLALLLPALTSVGAKSLYCADANYFKVLTKERKAEPHLGYVLPCGLPDYEHLDVVLGVNHKSLIYNPANEPKMELSINTLQEHLTGNYEGLGNNIIQSVEYLYSPTEVRDALMGLHQYPALTVDIEGFSLDFDKAGVGTITFCWSEHEGIGIAVDYGSTDAEAIRAEIKTFFEAYLGWTIWHNAPYDMKALIYNLWMKDLLDTEGLLTGLEVMTRAFHDTKLIAYLALNSCARNSYSLKDLAHPFAGNYAIDVKDITQHPVKDVLKYNVIDGLSTWYVFNTYYPKMVADGQEEIYRNLFLPSQKTIIQIELTGMPLNPKRVQEVRKELEDIVRGHWMTLRQSTAILDTEKHLTDLAYEKDYQDRKSKAKNPDKIEYKDRETFPKVTLNVNSGHQLAELLHTILELPVIEKTDTGLPATGGDVLDKLKNHTEDAEHHKILDALIGYGAADKILSTFIPAFEKAIEKGDNVVWLHGSFNLGGTVSGRLSSSDPNLQNLPAGQSGSKEKQYYGKLIKSCFQAPDGWLFTGADFNSLEDYISALTTKDPNKLKVYEQGYDGHSLRAFYYWRDQFPDIEETPESVNRIKREYPKLRTKSKAPTFALTYQGTVVTLMKNCGFPKEEAQQIFGSYHEMYKVSDEWVQAKLDEAARVGYVDVAFGLRVRTPLLHQSLRNHRKTPYEAQAEGRTAGNALGQSYGLLNNRAVNEFMQRVWASPYRHDIKPVALIHDAIYLLIRNRAEVLTWANVNLIDCMRWQELPEIQHEKVKLGAELSVFWPSWADELVLPNDINQDEVVRRSKEWCEDFKTKEKAA